MIKTLLSILLLSSMLIVTGCSSESEDNDEEVTNIFDPGIPGTNLGDNITVRPLINLQACPDINNDDCPDESFEEFGQVTLTWAVPNLYQTEEYVVVLFRLEKEGPFDSEETLLSLESPQNNLGVVPFEIARVKDTAYIDTDIREGSEYYYFGFVVIEGFLEPTPLTGEQVQGFWSSASKLEVATPSDGIGVGDPGPQKFWEKKRLDQYTLPTFDPDVIVGTTLQPGEPTITNPSGRVELDDSGSVMFLVDSANNRVLIYDNANLRNCLQQISQELTGDQELDDILIYSCYLQSAGSPASVSNILGQPVENTRLSCEEHNQECNFYNTEEACLADHAIPGTGLLEVRSFCNWNDSTETCSVKGNQCMTNPTDVLFENGKLLVSDTGNDRVLLYENIFFNPGETQDVADQVLIGCDPGLPIPINENNPIKCEAQKVFGKKSFNDFTKYTLSAGEAALNGPTGLFVDGEDLYIADTLNNRIVKVTRFYGTDEGDGADINEFYECNDSSWLTAKCRWSGVLGQENYTQVRSLEDFYQENNSILTGTFSNILEDPNLLKRYFRYPTEMKAVTKANGDILFLVTANEDFEATSDLGTKVALKGRVLIFDGIPLRGSGPECTGLSFPNGGCDAIDVMGQESFDKLIILSGSAGGAGDYKNIVYGLENINQLTLDGTQMFAVDNVNNFVYVWRDITNKTVAGFPYSFRVSDPEGKYINSTIGNLPNLKGLTGISFDPLGSKMYVIDGENGKTYQLDFLDFTF